MGADPERAHIFLQIKGLSILFKKEEGTSCGIQQSLGIPDFHDH